MEDNILYKLITDLLTSKRYNVSQIFIYTITSGSQQLIQLAINHNNKQRLITTKIKPEQTFLIERDILKIIKRRQFENMVNLQVPPNKQSNGLKIPSDTEFFIKQSLQVA
jgi:hypothetical protein